MQTRDPPSIVEFDQVLSLSGPCGHTVSGGAVMDIGDLSHTLCSATWERSGFQVAREGDEGN